MDKPFSTHTDIRTDISTDNHSDTGHRTPRTKQRVMPNPWSTRAATQMEPQMPASDELFVEAFARGLAVIRSFANRQQPLTIAEVGRRACVSRSAARRLLHTLVTLGYASFSERGFTLLPKTLTLGSAFLSSDVLVELGQPAVNRLAADLGGSFCSLNVLQGYESQLVCIAHLFQPTGLRMAEPNIGMGAPLYCSTSGQVFLSTFTEAQLNDYLDHIQLHAYTHRTVTNPDLLRQKLKLVQERGYAMIDRELSEDLRSISIAVQDRSGSVVATLVSMSTPKQASMSDLQGRLPMMRAAAQELGRQL